MGIWTDESSFRDMSVSSVVEPKYLNHSALAAAGKCPSNDHILIFVRWKHLVRGDQCLVKASS